MNSFRWSMIDEALASFDQRHRDEQWLKGWIEQKRRAKKTIRLSDYRSQLIEHARLLESYRMAIEHGNSSSLSELKDLIDRSNEKIYHAPTIKTIQREIRRRRRKRKRTRHEKQSQTTKPTEIPRKTFRQKIRDVQEIVENISFCKTLDVGSSSTREQLNELETICRMKINEYEREMEKNPQEDLCDYLFNNDGFSFYETSRSDGNDFLQAHRTIENLVLNRRSWDQFADNQKKKSDQVMPSQWHEPTLPSNSDWSVYIFQRQSS